MDEHWTERVERLERDLEDYKAFYSKALKDWAEVKQEKRAIETRLESELSRVKAEHRTLENAYIEQGMILEAIEKAKDGTEPSDFEQSYGIVREVWELYLAAKEE